MYKRQYQNARSRAYDDSMGFIAGKQGVRNTDLNTILASRGSQLGQAGDVLGAGIGMMSQLPSVPSAMNGYNFGNVGSGMYDRGFQSSANNFQDRYGLGSGADDGFFNIQSGISNLTGPRSAGYDGGINMTSGVYSPYAATGFNPGGFATNMNSYATLSYTHLTLQTNREV